MPHTIRARSLAAAAALVLLAAACGESPTAGVPGESETPAPTPPAPSVEKPFYAGAYLGDAGTKPETVEGAIRAFAAMTGKQPAFVKSYHTLDCDFSATGWCGKVVRKIAGTGSTNYVALDPRWAGAPATGLLDAVNAGQADAALARVARGLASVPGTVLVEPAWEMNGDWAYRWQGVENGGAAAPAKFRDAWRRIVSAFRAAGATNVRFVFNPNVGNPLTLRATGSAHWNWYGNYYPGDSYVDYVGAHGFNAPELWGGSWQDFATMTDGAAADRMLSDLAARYPGKPIILGEMATSEGTAGQKAAWIADAYRRMREHPSVVGAVWFHTVKEADWRVDSSPAALEAYRAAVAAPQVRTAFSPAGPTHTRLAGR